MYIIKKCQGGHDLTLDMEANYQLVYDYQGAAYRVTMVTRR